MEDTKKVEDTFQKNRFKVDEQTSGMKILFKVSLSKEKCDMKRYVWVIAVVLLINIIGSPSRSTLAMKLDWQEVATGNLRLSVPKEWKVRITPISGAEFYVNDEMIGYIAYGKNDPEVPLEYHLGNHVVNYKVTKLSGYDFSEVYRYDVSKDEPAAAKSSKITNQVYFFFIDKVHNVGIALVLLKSAVDDNTIMKISETVKMKNT